MNHKYFFEKLVGNNPNIFFLEIGAMDGLTYDELFIHIKKYKWAGIMVEPIKSMFNKLKDNYKNNTNIIFENSAIAEKSGTSSMFKIPENLIKSGEAIWYADGISSFFLDSIKRSWPQIDPNILVKEEVNCLSFEDLVSKYSVERIDILQIDAEGCEYIIFKQINLNIYRPKYINIETRNLTKSDIKNICIKLSNAKYEFYFDNKTIIAICDDTKYGVDIKKIWCDQIWKYYEDKKWKKLLKYCKLYKKIYPLVDNYMYYVKFYIAYSLVNLKQLDLAETKYKNLLNYSSLSDDLVEWVKFNIDYIQKLKNDNI